MNSYLYTYIYFYMYLSIYMHIYLHMHIYRYVYIHTQNMYASLRVWRVTVCVRFSEYVCIDVYAWTFVRVNAHARPCGHIFLLKKTWMSKQVCVYGCESAAVHVCVYQCVRACLGFHTEVSLHLRNWKNTYTFSGVRWNC